jgi:hypothetical protein
MNAEAELSLMRSIVLVAGFRGTEFNSVQAAMLLIGLKGGDFSAAEIPRDLTRGDKHISGLATKTLLKMGLLEKVGYIPSPNKDAKGRPVLALRIPANKIATVKTWLICHGYLDSAPTQLTLLTA